MAILPVHMHDEQDQPGCRREQDRAQCVPSLLARFIHAVGQNQAVWILKRFGCEFKTDAVFSLILIVLALVPFLARVYIHIVARPALRFRSLSDC
jgi:hypothetical protein